MTSRVPFSAAATALFLVLALAFAACSSNGPVSYASNDSGAPIGADGAVESGGGESGSGSPGGGSGGGSSSSSGGGTPLDAASPSDATSAGDALCLPDPTDCAGKCGKVNDHCGFVVECGPCAGDAGGGAGDGGGDGGGASGVYCTQASAAQCDCGDVSSTYHAPNATPCSAAQVGGTALCCGTTGWSGTLNSACFCETWGCSGATCGLGFGPATSATAPAGGVCCATDTYPSCTCSIATACPVGSTQVTKCDATTAVCGAGYSYPVTVAACR